MNLASAFTNSATASMDKPAIHWGDSSVLYGALLHQARAVAHMLKEKFAVEPGMRVGLLLKNRPEFVPAMFGVLMAGAVVVPFNTFLKPDEITFIINDAGVDVLLTEQAMEETLAVLRDRLPDLRTWNVEHLEDLGQARTDAAPLATRTAGDLAVIVYTSGTTGHPKGAMLTHGNLLHNVESCRKVLRIVDHDRFVLLLPMFHSFMLTVCILLPLLTGGSIVLVRGLTQQKAMVQEIIANRGSILPAMASLFRALAGLPAGAKLPLRLCISGAGPLPGEILRMFNERFPEVPLIEGYGLSEASPVVTINPVQGPWKAGSIGVPIHGVEVSVQDESGNSLAVGEEGEICVRGGNVMAGYWNNPTATAASMREEWLLTGDIGKADPEGYFYITDRKKDMLKPNGMNVYPREIEEVLYKFPGIREAAVIGEPCDRRGERAVAYVSLDQGITLDERALIEFLKSHLADYKVPRRAFVLPALPRNATGKILKTELRKLHAAKRED